MMILFQKMVFFRNRLDQRCLVPTSALGLLLSLPLSASAQRLDPLLPANPHVIKRIVARPAFTKPQLNHALIAEAFHGNITHVARPLTQGADPNAKGPTGIPALCYVVAAKVSAAKSASVMTLLLSRGAHINTADGRGNTALTEAVGLEASTLAVPQQQRGATPNVRNAAGFTPLGIATVGSDTPLMHLLIAHGANINAPQQKGMTPLALAAALEHPEAVRLLLEAGAPVNPNVNPNTSTPLLLIALAGSRRTGASSKDADVVLLALLDHGASPNVRGADGTTPLLVSAAFGNLIATCLLIEHGAAVNAPDHLGRTALTLAAAQGNAPLVHLLLINSAAINVQDKGGDTPLLWAVRGKHSEQAQ